MITKRLAPGAYEIHTDAGTFEIDRVRYEYGDLISTEWFITWPGEPSPDVVAPTLRDAKAIVATEITTTPNDRSNKS